MAKLPFICPVALEVQAALDERRIPDAKRIAAEHLRRGYHSQEFLNIVAKMLQVKVQSGVRGPKRKKPPHWLEIGNDFQELRDAGDSYEIACVKLAKKYGCSEGTIRTTRAFFEKAHREHDEIR
jgi:uncharacterized coiled-coil protein SlyX